MSRHLLIAMTALLVIGCDDTFDPVADYRDRIVVYSILDTYADTQFVRVASTYNAPGHNPDNQTSDTPIIGASVTVSDVSRTFSFRDTLLPRPPGSRYSTPIAAYYRDQFRPVRGGLYLLEVTSPIGSAVASVRVPTSSFVYTTDVHLIQSPTTNPATSPIILRAILSEFTFAYFFRVFLDYEIADAGAPGGWRPETIEIPLSISTADSLENLTGRYPALRKRGTNPAENVIQARADIETFSNGVYTRVIQVLRKKYRPGVIRFLRARVVLYQTDEQFYKYTRIASGFSDQNSVRTDEPDFTNVTGGRGLFGVSARDTMSIFVAQGLGL